MKVNRQLPGFVAGRKARIEMLPLIDIVFLLLVFFIYAMLSMAVHRDLPVALPESSRAEIDNRISLSLVITASGNLRLDDQPVQLADLPARIREKTAAAADPEIRVYGDRHLQYQELFRVLDLIKEAGMTRISLQAEAKTDP